MCGAENHHNQNHRRYNNPNWQEEEIESFMIKNSFSYKDYAIASTVKAKTNHKVTCSCLGSKPGIINTDVLAHLPNCWVRRRLLSKRFTVNTSAVPSECDDGYVLGVATK